MLYSSIFFLLISLGTYAQSKKVSQMQDEFIQSAFLINSESMFVVKWENKDTLRYHIEGDLQFISQKNWNKYINEVSGLVDKRIVETEDFDEADIHIYFGELVNYFAKYNITYGHEVMANNNFDNWSSRHYNINQQLLSTNFCIVPSKTRRDIRGDYNMKRLFLKSLGILGTFDSRTSLFNANSSEPLIILTKEDKRLIKLFYSDAIKAGMNLSEVKLALNEMDLEAFYNEKL